jgi:hypothetical protein
MHDERVPKTHTRVPNKAGSEETGNRSGSSNSSPPRDSPAEAVLGVEQLRVSGVSGLLDERAGKKL